MQVVQAYRFVLDPIPGQARALAAHCGAARFAFNWGLALIKANLGQRAAERSYGIVDAELTPSLPWSMYALRKAWNQAKDEVAPWWPECSKEAYACGLERLAAALKNWAGSRMGERRGRAMGFPSFRSKHKTRPSVRFTTGTIRLDGRTHVVLPRLGRIKTHESTRKLARRIEAGTARIASATVRWEAGRWQVAFSVHVDRPARTPRRPEAVVGVDLGVRTLAVFSDDRPPAANPRHLADASKRLRRAARAVSRKIGPDRRIGQRPSGRWQRANAARTFTCPACGLVLDRDRNAARNLASLVHHVAGSGPETTNGRGADQKTPPRGAGGHETSTPHRATGQDGDLHPAMGESLRLTDIQ